jgi:two-component system phosphate regulon response regulator PhoB
MELAKRESCGGSKGSEVNRFNVSQEIAPAFRNAIEKGSAWGRSFMNYAAVKILLVEDSEQVQILVRSALQSVAELQCVSKLSEAEMALQSQRFDLVIFDLGLPDGDGIHFFSKWKEELHQSDTLVYFLTGKDQPEDKVMAFALGADEYMTKPFHPLELKARITSRLEKKNRIKQKGESPWVYRDEIRVYPVQQKMEKKLASGDWEEVSLTPIEHRILLMLIKKPGEVRTRKEIHEFVWGSKVHLSERTIDTHVSHLRKKTGDSVIRITSVPGVGYRLELVETSHTEAA